MTKVLIIRFSSIGDMVLTTPVVRNLKLQMHGGVEIHYLTKKVFRGIVDSNPHVSKVYAIEKSTDEVIESLKEEQYDYVIDLHRNLRSFRVKRGLKVLDFTFKKYNWQKWLLVNFGINRMPKAHIVDRYMACLDVFGIVNDNEGLDYFLPEGESAYRKSMPESHRKGYIALAIGAAHWRKRLRTAQYLEICQIISAPIVLLGGQKEMDEAEEIATTAGAHVWNAAGHFNLDGSAELVRDCRVLITPDTGLMHIGAAFRKPIISFWAATIPAFGMYPYQNRALNEMIEADHLQRRPCSKLGTKCKYKECRCIDELSLEEIQKAAEAAFGAAITE